MFFLSQGKISKKTREKKRMKKVLGILAISCICILLGLSVRWNKDKDVSLAILADNCGKWCEMI